MVRRQTSGLSCLVAIDKPEGPSSHGVVQHVRKALGERRVGHAGTLDPAASGVLVVGIGQATRLLGLLALDDKRYDAVIRFGSETNTDDAEGEVTRTCAVPDVLADRRQAAAYLVSLVGEHMQVPPAYSAISQNGKRAYARARAGEEVALDPRPIRILDARLDDVDCVDGGLVWRCSFHVSKGTYVRSIARDIGRDLGTAAHLGALRRTASGLVDLKSCITLDELDREGASLCSRRSVDPLLALSLPVRTIDASEARFVANGRQIACGVVRDIDSTSARVPERGERVALVCQDRLVGVWERVGDKLASVSNLPGGVGGVRR